MTASLQRALELTENVHEAIQAGDWLRAAELEQERRAAIEAFANAQGAAPALQALQERSLHMIGEVHHHRRRVLREAATVQTQRSAVQAYENA